MGQPGVRPQYLQVNAPNVTMATMSGPMGQPQGQPAPPYGRGGAGQGPPPCHPTQQNQQFTQQQQQQQQVRHQFLVMQQLLQKKQERAQNPQATGPNMMGQQQQHQMGQQPGNPYSHQPPPY
uniref:Uncharacterized protein n=1 Tax=Timema genevievae TaxID=629358 RepID=A0A7R9PKA7_TIMGE|nr:unnamed protein product [Timema genevievae]